MVIRRTRNLRVIIEMQSSCVTIKNEYDVNLKTGFKTNLNEFSVKNPIGFPLRLLVLKCEVKWSSFVRWPCEKKRNVPWQTNQCRPITFNEVVPKKDIAENKVFN